MNYMYMYLYTPIYIYLLYVIIYDYVHAIRQTPQKEGRKLRPSLQIFQDVHGRRDRRRPHNGGVKPMDPGVMKGDPGVPGWSTLVDSRLGVSVHMKESFKNRNVCEPGDPTGSLCQIAEWWYKKGWLVLAVGLLCFD